MDELQKARADYIAALERENALAQECVRLKQKNHALQMQLTFAQFNASMLKSLYDGLSRSFFSDLRERVEKRS